MAEKISVQIALEGGKEVERQLADIGEAGQKAFADITKSAEQVGGFKSLKPEEVTAKLKAAGIEGTAAFDKIQQAVQKAAKFETLVQGVQSIENAFVVLGRAAGPVGLAIAAAFQAATKATIAFSETIGKASDQAVKLGVSFEQFKTIREDLAKVGVSASGAAEGLRNFQKQLGEPRTDIVNVLTATGNVFRFVGTTVNLAANELPKFREQLQGMPDGLARTNLAIQQLGEAAGTEMIQGLRRAEGSMSSSEQKAYDLQQALGQLKQAWDNLGSVGLAPTLTAGISIATQAIQALNAALERSPWGTFLQAASLALNPIAGLVQQATKAILNLASSLTGITWDTISSGATAAWQALTTAIQGAGTAITDFISQIGSITWDAISSAGVAAWNAITSAIQNTINKLLEFIGLKEKSGGGGGAIQGKARGGLIGGTGSGTSDSNLAWVSRGEHVMPASVVRQPGMLGLLEALRRGGGIPGFQAGGPVGNTLAALGNIRIADQISSWITIIAAASNETRNALLQTQIALARVIQGIDAIANSFTEKLLGILQPMTTLVNTLRQLGLAHGGLIGGRGTGTSDSNLAWLSRGEYVTPARAVAQPGVLEFLEALRRSGGNLSAVLDGMGRFALGGMVPVSGGGMSHVTISFPGVAPVAGLRASTAVVDELRRAAALAQVRSGGRKPSRYS